MFRAICRTLVHSLWEGLLLAVVAAIIIICTKHHKASTRYNLLVASFTLFVLAVGGTFVFELISSTSSVAVDNNIVAQNNIAAIAYSNSSITTSHSSTIPDWFIAWIDRNAIVISVCWILIMLFKSIRLAFGLRNIHQLRNNYVSEVNDHWKHRMADLSSSLGIRKTITLLNSELVKVPVVIGCLKPMILFPAALMASMPVDEIESVIIHELAHIRRKDFLVNLLQQVAELVLFFNPAVLWVSSLMRTEREHCCDDIAIGKTQNRFNYIKALVTFQEYQISIPVLAPAFPGRKKQLLDRVQRIISSNNKTLNAMEKFLLTSGLAVTGIVVLSFASGQKETKLKTEPSKVIVAKASAKEVQNVNESAQKKDTLPEALKKIQLDGVSNINTELNGKRYELKLRDNKVTELKIDGKKVEESKIDDYKSVTDEIVERAHQNILNEKAAAEKALSLVEIDREKANAELMVMDKMKAMEFTQLKEKAINDKLLQELSELKAREFALSQLSTAHLEESLRKLRSLSDCDKATQELQLLEKLKAEHLVMQSNLADLSGKLNGDLTKELIEKSKMNAELAMRKDMKLYKEHMFAGNAIIDDLIKDGVIKDAKSLTFTLNNNELVVNGQKQPDSVFKRYKEKYVKSEDWNINYNNTREQ